MSLVLSGTNGLSDVDGTAATPAIRGTDTNTGIFFPAADTIAFSEGGVESMRIDSSGNVGIGISANSSSKFQVKAATNSNFAVWDSSGTPMILGLTDAGASQSLRIAGNPLTFTGNGGGGAEAMRIDSSGNMFIGTTSGSAKLNVAGDVDLRSTSNFIYTNNIGAVSSSASILVRNSTQGVQLVANATAWTSASDERLKTNLSPITNAVSKVASLRPVTGRYNNDEETVSRAFVIAQEVQQVFPEAVSEIEQDGEKYLGLQYTDLIPLLTAAIQEQQALITTLTDRITALEAK
jgi:hypothetical protein